MTAAARRAPVDCPLLEAKEAAAYLNVSRTFMTEHAVELGGRKVGSRLKFVRADLDAYLERQRVKPVVALPTPIRTATPRPVSKPKPRPPGWVAL